MGTLDALGKQGFLKDNIYYDTLKTGDTLLKQIKTQYELVFAQVDDKTLKRKLIRLWRLEHTVYSARIFSALSKQNPKIPNTLQGYKIGRIGEQINEYVFNKGL